MTPEELSDAITHVLKDTIAAGQLTLVDGADLPQVRVERPKSREHGDWATNLALQLAKKVGKNPREVATVLADKIASIPGVSTVDIAGPGFLNITLDAAAAGTRFDKGMSKLLYTRYFLKSLLPKAAATGFQTTSLKECKTLGDFDDRFTAPLHGFADRHDYYRRASCKPWLKTVRTPLLLLNAVNDPFLPPKALPTVEEVSSAVTLLQPQYGGHAAFVSHDKGRLNLQWLPQTLLAYFEAFE